MDAGEAQPKRFAPLSEAQPVTFCCVAELAKVIATIEANGLTGWRNQRGGAPVEVCSAD